MAEMTAGLRRAWLLIFEDADLKAELIRDPKGTVLYTLPDRMPGQPQLSVDDELFLVGVAEEWADNPWLPPPIVEPAAPS